MRQQLAVRHGWCPVCPGRGVGRDVQVPWNQASPASIEPHASVSCTLASLSDLTSPPVRTKPALVGVEQGVAVSSLPVGGDHLDAGLLHRTAHTTGLSATAGTANYRSGVLRMSAEIHRRRRPRLRGAAAGGCGLFAGTGLGRPGYATVLRFPPDRERGRGSRCTRCAARPSCAATATPRTPGWQLLGVMHSHTHTEAYPSPTDVRQAPDETWHYVIVSMRDDVRRGGRAPSSTARSPRSRSN